MTESEAEPQPQQQQREHSNPYTLWFVMLSFVAPVAAAYFMFFFGEIESFSNNGEFIRPVVKLEQLALKTGDGAAFDKQALNKKWHLFAVTGKECNDACQKTLINMRQMTRAVKRPPKVRYAVVNTGEPADSFQQFMAQELDRAVVLEGEFETLMSALQLDMTSGTDTHYYLSDYHGNLVMKFSTALEYKLVIEDLNRLF